MMLFFGPDYIFACLPTCMCKDQTTRKFKLSPNAEPAIFVGWRLDFGLRCKGLLYFVLYSHLKEDLSVIRISQFHDAEVYIPKEMTFPWHLVAEKALHNLGDPRRAEFLDIGSLPIPFVDSTPEAKQESKGLHHV